MTTQSLRQQKRILAARARRGIATASELRKLNYTRAILSFRREVFEAADRAMGDANP